MLDLRKFFHATNPSRTLSAKNEEDQKYYIDFSSVRGGKIIEELKDNITFFSPDKPTCELFTGHIGCGKSTELLRLKADLEREGFHVIYFESDQDLEVCDVDISDILLAIARQVSESLKDLEKLEIAEPKGLKSLLAGAAKLLQTEMEVSAEATIPGIGKVTASKGEQFSLEADILGLGQVSANSKKGISLVALGIGKITAKAKNSPELRSKLRNYLEPRTNGILEAINSELLTPAKEKLKQHGKKGLVVIVDNLDRLENSQKPWGRLQTEYLFVDRGDQLRQLDCHVVYTMPLDLLFSNAIGRLTQRFMVDPKVLPMVSVRLRDGTECAEGMALLRQMVLARAFPEVSPEQRVNLITKVFDSPQTLDYLCRVSGGHVRELLRLLNDWIKKYRTPPLGREGLESVIRTRRNQMSLAITEDEWELLREVHKRKLVTGDDGYLVLIRSMFVYEYRDSQGSWFEVNPILAEAEELNG